MRLDRPLQLGDALSRILRLGFRDSLGNPHPPSPLPVEIAERNRIRGARALEGLEGLAAKPLVLVDTLQECAGERERQIPVTVFRDRPQARGNLLIFEVAQRGTGSLDRGPENKTEVAGDVHRCLTGSLVLP